MKTSEFLLRLMVFEKLEVIMDSLGTKYALCSQTAQN